MTATLDHDVSESELKRFHEDVGALCERLEVFLEQRLFINIDHCDSMCVVCVRESDKPLCAFERPQLGKLKFVRARLFPTISEAMDFVKTLIVPDHERANA